MAEGFFALGGIALGWALNELSRILADRRAAAKEVHDSRRTARKAALLILAELRAARRAAEADRQMPTDVWNREREVLGMDPAFNEPWMDAASAFEQVDLANNGDVDAADVVPLIEKAEDSLWKLIIRAEADEGLHPGIPPS